MPRNATRRPAPRLRPRHPAGGGYARGERTRGRIIEAAIDMFASSGYERTATRAIAKKAAVSLPALQYYFGGKAGLHRACAEHITADMRARLAPAVARVSQALGRPRLARAELLELLERVLDPLLESMATERPQSWVLFLTRAQIERTAAFDALFDEVIGTIMRLTAEIVARLAGVAPGDPRALIRTLAVVGPIVMIRRGRPILLAALGWPDLAGERLELLRETLWSQIVKGLARR